MQNHIKTETRLALIQFIFSSFFSDLSLIEHSNDFEKYFNKLSISSIDQNEELLIKFNKNYFNKLTINYNKFIKNNNVENIINSLINFDRKFDSWDNINKSIILSIFSELEITKKEKIKILLNDYLNISKLLIPKKELGMINAITDKYINEKNII
jgi:transcription termination factor NusB